MVGVVKIYTVYTIRTINEQLEKSEVLICLFLE
jgi:hypothetical protein